MASSMAAAAAHSMPPFPLPAIPRVRPPPIPKGTPGPNTLPQPGPAPRSDLIWADGRWASPHSRSAKHKRAVVSKQLEKALQHEVHGMNIYAYKHIRTHQVVYSLTKNMDNSKILRQLMYHGKKTVPAALRRDVWRPYFSVHFPQTPAGAMKGLKVYQELRELSVLRQLSPPRYMSIATKEDIEQMKLSYDPIEWRDKTETEKGKAKLLVPPVIGERLPKQMLARRLMNQAATSVADVAAILTRQTTPKDWVVRRREVGEKALEGTGPTPQQQRDIAIERKKFNEDVQSIRANNRLMEIRKKEEAKALDIEQRQRYLDTTSGMIKIDKHARDRISMEYDGVGNKLNMIEEADEATAAESAASETLNVTLEEIENQKQTQRRTMERTMSAEIEQRLNQLSEAERSQIEKEVDAERAQRQAEIDEQITALQDDLKVQRAELYKLPPSTHRTRALRKLSRDGHAQVYALKLNLRTRYLKWAGPFASIATEIDQAMSNIDSAWAPRLAEIQEEVQAEKERNTDPTNHEVEIRWANIRDGTHAKSWPDSVFHLELQPKAVSKARSRTITTHFHLDADEERIETQHGTTEVPRRNTVHVFGSVAPDADDTRTKGRYESPTEMARKQTEIRNMRVQEWANTEAVLMRDRILAMRSETRALKSQFADIPFDEEACPYIAASLASVDTAQKILEQMDRRSYQPSDVQAMQDQILYIRDLQPTCLGEIADSAHPLANEARAKYAISSAELLELQVNNLEAYHQANMREDYLHLFDQRDGLVDSIERFKNDATVRTQEERELRNFDRQYPFISDIHARREALVETLQAEIEDREAEVERLKTEIQTAKNGTANQDTNLDADAVGSQQEQLAQLMEQLTSETRTLKSQEKQLAQLSKENEAGGKILRQAIKADKEAWLEYKRAGGRDAYDGGLGAYQDPYERRHEAEQRQVEAKKSGEKGHGMVMGDPDADKGFFGRVKGFFGAGSRKR